MRNIAAAGLLDRIDVRKGDGLGVLAPGEADAVVIAGMGGATITDILDAGEDRLEGVGVLLLQPNVGARDVRRWLHDHGWFLRDECVLEEDGVFYDILEAVPAQPREGERATGCTSRLPPAAGRSWFRPTCSCCSARISCGGLPGHSSTGGGRRSPSGSGSSRA